jgi:hypothetical protein
VADAAALNELKGLEVGMEVRATFGTTTVPGEARMTNNLLSIRRCVADDAECDADRQREDAEWAARRLASEARDHEQEICFAAMRATLAKDDRYIIDPNEDDELSDEMDRRHVALVGKQRECSKALLGRHQRAYLEACELHRCAQDIAGGCDHLAGQEISDAAIERAVETCGDQ